MAGEFEVVPSSLRSGGLGIADVAERLAREWQAFSSQVEAMGDIFGDDAVGGLIAASYQAAHQIADASFSSVAEAFLDFGDALQAMADNYEATEQAIVDAFNRLAR